MTASQRLIYNCIRSVAVRKLDFNQFYITHGDPNGVVEVPNTIPAICCDPQAEIVYVKTDGTPGNMGWVQNDLINSSFSNTPSSLNLADMIGYFTFGDLPGITSITFSSVHSLAGFDIEGGSAISSLSWPHLIDIDPTDSQHGYFLIFGLAALTTISAPLLTLVGAGVSFSAQSAISIQNCSSLTDIDFSELSGMTGNLVIQNNASLVTVDLPQLVSISGHDLIVAGNHLLTTINMPKWVPVNLCDIIATGNALTAASVDGLLARCVSNPAYVQSSINFSGGTNSPPSSTAPGSDYATLIARGVVININ